MDTSRRTDTLQLNDSPITLVSSSPTPNKNGKNILEIISKPLLLQSSR